MKKIFAIALALVMVLSMTSAFAGVGTCGLVDAYTCATVGCGVAKAEVVHFVADNSADGFSENACAAVVKGQPVYWGIKVTFDADVNEQWFDHANTMLQVETKNIAAGAKATDYKVNLKGLFAPAKSASDVSGKVFWFDGTNLVSTFDAQTCVFGGTANNTKVEVCANVLYDFDGMNTVIDYASFKVLVATSTDAEYVITVTKGGDTMNVYVVGGEAKFVEFDGGIYYMSKGNLLFAKGATIKAGKLDGGDPAGTASVTCSDLYTMMGLINIEFNDCVNKSVIKKIFGWANGDAVCATWSKDAVAIVDANCVLSIPKTGDVSVVAYAVMAVVAAAGTMLKK